VEVVPEVVELVADVEVDVVGVVEVDELELVVVLLVVGVVELEVELVVVLVELVDADGAGAGHSRSASPATTVAPCATALLSDGSIPERLLAEFVNVVAAPATSAQRRETSAVETEFSWSLSVLAWSADRSPPLPPQAASNAAAKPTAPARSARGT
jgi:hypothetical protein